MGDLFSFVSACGANDFSLRPLCDVDRLIFAQLSYCDFLSAMPFAPCPLPQAIRAMLAAAPSPDASEERFAFQRSDDQRLLSLLSARPALCADHVHRLYPPAVSGWAAVCRPDAGNRRRAPAGLSRHG